MGASGIRRRKPAHHLPKVHGNMSEAEVARAFGNFRWGAYTPAGSIERAGFFARQVSRRRRHPEWREYNRGVVVAGSIMLALFYGALAFLALAAFAQRLAGFP